MCKPQTEISLKRCSGAAAFFCEIFENFKNTFLYKRPLVAISVKTQIIPSSCLSEISLLWEFKFKIKVNS